MMVEVCLIKIDSLAIHLLRLPLVRPFTTSFGEQRDKEALLVAVRAGGITGWGECVASPDPYYSYETNETAISVIRHYLSPVLRDLRDFSVTEAMAAFAPVRGHAMAKAALENALLDLTAKKEGLPLWRLLGGQEKHIPSGISIGLQASDEALLESVAAARAKKYQRIKIKIKRGRDVAMVGKVRAAFPDCRLMVDANGDYQIADFTLLRQLDEFRLLMIEQPLAEDDLFWHAELQKTLVTPLCLDESIRCLADVQVAQRLGSCRIINIKQGRVGGLLESYRIQDFCRKNGMPVWSGGMLETGIGRAANIHLQTLPGFTLPGDTSETARYFVEDIVDPAVVLDGDGFIAIPPGPGLGVQVVAKRLAKYQVLGETLW